MSSFEPAGEELSRVRDNPDDRDDLPRAAREGLPPTYRMRADSHYVDLLTSRLPSGRERLVAVHEIESPPLAEAAAVAPLAESIGRHGVLQPLLVQVRHGRHRLIAGHKRLSAAVAAGIPHVPCHLFDVDDDEAQRLAAAARLPGATPGGTPAALAARDTASWGDEVLEQSLRTLASCTDFLSGADSELSRTIASTLLRAEMWRAICLLKATRIFRAARQSQRATMPVARILDRVVTGFLPERRLRAIQFDVKSSLPADCVMITDEELLLAALCSAVRGTLSLFGEAPGALLTITAAADSHELMNFALSQNTVSVPDQWFDQAFDPGWINRPGGQIALVSMVASRQAAEALGGRVHVSASGRGTTIGVSVPWGL